MRRMLTLTLATTGMLVAALPAHAKVAGTAHISGPGIGGGDGGGITMGGTDGSGYPVMSGLLNPAESLTAEPKGDLGPRYRVRFVIEEPPGQPPIVQHLYPFAEGGPVIFTSAGQEWLGGTNGDAPAGWYRPGPGLIEELQDRGLPETSPSASGAPEARDLPAAADRRFPVVWGIVIVAALLVAAAAAGRRRAAARPVEPA